MDLKHGNAETGSDTPTLFSETPCQLFVNNSQYILKVFKELYEDKRLCDVYFKVGDKEYGAHKLILSASSDVFQVMLMKKDWNECHQNHIKLCEVSECEKVFSSFLKYFYTGELIITHTNVLPLLSLADKYIVKSLSKLCLQYMDDHLSHASCHNQLFSWLQYFQSCGHKEMAEISEEFIRLNFEAVSESADFSNLDPENMVNILKEDDLVIHDEAMLYNCVVKWLDLQKSKLEDEHAEVKNAEEIAEYVKYLTTLVMQHIRFPMMKPREIADLLRSPLVKENIEFFMDRMSTSVELHSGNDNKISESWLEDNQHLLQPRLYTVDNYSAYLVIDDLSALSDFERLTWYFKSDTSVFECKRSLGKNWWEGFLYPKGVNFEPCYLLLFQGTYEIPKKHLATVRLKITCTTLYKPGKYKFSILVFGVKGEVQYVMKVKSEIHYISEKNTSINIDDIIPFHFLNPSEENIKNKLDNPYLIGAHRKSLKLQILIIPLT